MRYSIKKRKMSDSNTIWTHNHLVRKRTLNHLAKRVRYMILTYSQMHRTVKYSQHSLII